MENQEHPVLAVITHPKPTISALSTMSSKPTSTLITMPVDADAERVLVAACIIDMGVTIDLALGLGLTADHFFEPRHATIFGAILALNRQGVAVDEITVTDVLRRDGSLEAAGGVAYVNELTSMVTSTGNSRRWAEIVREKHQLRRLISVSQAVIEGAVTMADSADVLVDRAERDILAISGGGVDTSVQPISQASAEALAGINQIISTGTAMQGLSSGFVDLDRLTNGLKAGQMIVVAARPAMGKTALALNLIEHLAVGNNHKRAVLMFSLEMPTRELVTRLICSRAGVSVGQMANAKNSPGRIRSDIETAAQEVSTAGVYIDDTGGQTIAQLRAKARRVHARTPLDLIVVDYIQLVNGSDTRLPREQQVAEVSRGIKALAKELGVPVVILAQLNRKSEDEARQPGLADLRESGSIEQDADMVMLISRPKGERNDDKAETPGVWARDLLVAKNRNGPTGRVSLLFEAAYARFRSPARPSDKN